jgi:hypothetical protein
MQGVIDLAMSEQPRGLRYAKATPCPQPGGATLSRVGFRSRSYIAIAKGIFIPEILSQLIHSLPTVNRDGCIGLFEVSMRDCAHVSWRHTSGQDPQAKEDFKVYSIESAELLQECKQR